nr:hypothetical protein [Tanacetum cinerariifolium]
MENVPPPNGNPNAPEEEPFIDQAPVAFVGFAPQWIGEQILNNNNGWLEEEPEEEEEEEENKAIKDDDEDDAEVINPYEEADPHNRPPPASDEETEFVLPVVQIADVDNIPVLPVILFGNFHVRESSASRDLLKGNDEVYVPSPIPCDLRSVHRGVKRLSKQMHNRYKTEKRMEKILKQEELRRNGQAFDIIALDSTVRANTSESLKMMRLITDLSREFSELKCQNRRAEETMPLKRRSQTNPQLTLTQEDVDQLVQDGIAAAIRDKCKRVRREATRAEDPMRDPVTAPIARECSFASFMKCGPTQFHGTEGAVGLVRWLKRWRIPLKSVNRLEDELRHLKLRDMNIAAYTKRFNELALLCPDAILNEKKKVELYIKDFPEIIKGEATSYKPVTLNEAKAGPGAAVQPNIVCYSCGKRDHKSSECLKKANKRGGNVPGQAYVIRDADHNQGPNVVT